MARTTNFAGAGTMGSRRRFGPYAVAPIGLGCMNLSHAYGEPVSAEQGERLLRHALDAGVTLFDTAALYGFGANETLVGRVLAPVRDRITLASKGGMAGEPGSDGALRRVIDGHPKAIRRHCEASLQRLGTDHIDLYYLHRWHKAVPIEESVGAMADLKREGKIGALGLSEVSAATLRKAHREHPIAAVQSEYSLASREAGIAVVDACRELGAAFVAFSPVGRGLLTDTPIDAHALTAKDIRRAMPRFAPDALAANETAVRAPLKAIAAQAGCSVAQLALAWLLAQGEHVIPIPGTTSVAHLDEDLGAAGVALSADVLAALDAAVNEKTVVGARYNAQSQGEVDTEQFAPAG